MAEYTYKDVIIDPDDPRVEIGKEYYFGCLPRDVLKKANTNSSLIGELKEIRKEDNFPFVFMDFTEGRSCIIRKKELPYAARQTKWLADNGINKGDKVRIVRKADNYEGGWFRFWNPDMTKAVGKVGTVSHISTNRGGASGIEVDVLDVGPFLYPYFVLKKVEQKYVLFDLSEKKVRDELRGKWIIPKGHSDSIETQITLFGSQMTEYGKIWCVDMDITPDKLLASWTFIDGTPCGKLVEQINDQTN